MNAAGCHTLRSVLIAGVIAAASVMAFAQSPECTAPSAATVDFEWKGVTRPCGSATMQPCFFNEVIQFTPVARGGYAFDACEHQFAWDFNDGTGSFDRAPLHTFRGDLTTFVVTLRVVNEAGTAVIRKAVPIGTFVPPPCAPLRPENVYFDWYGSTSGCSSANSQNCATGETIQFSARSYFYNFECQPHIFLWSFGDSSPDVSGQNRTHAFQYPGDYVVKLRVTNSMGVSVEVGSVVRVGGGGTTPPTIDSFTATPTRVLRGQPVKLSWFLRNATGVRIDPLGITRPPAGSETIYPTRSQRYTLTSFGAPLFGTAFVDVVVVEGRQRATRR